MRWLVTSLVLSVVLTVLLNIALRAFPGAGDRLARSLDGPATSEADLSHRDGRRTRVIVPWKAMIVASVVLTILLNVLIWVV